MDSSMEKENFCLENGDSPFSMRCLNENLMDIPQMMDVDESPTPKSPWLSSVSLTSNCPLQDSPFAQFKVKKKRNKESSSFLNESVHMIKEETYNVTPTRKAFAPVNYGHNVDKTCNSKPCKDFSPCGNPNLIKMAVQKSMQNPDLIGDFSKSCILPVISGKHQDLKSISSETVIEVLTGRFHGNFIIIDCRYPYEYDGGHIIGAKNFYTKDSIVSALLPMKDSVKVQESKDVLIFYCEFSSERAPKMYRFLREKDRNLNMETYPLLHYPEIYILNGGYNAFYLKSKEYCEPQAYIAMLDKNHTQDMIQFRSECKSDGNNQQHRRSRAKARAGLKF